MKLVCLQFSSGFFSIFFLLSLSILEKNTLISQVHLHLSISLKKSSQPKGKLSKLNSLTLHFFSPKSIFFANTSWQMQNNRVLLERSRIEQRRCFQNDSGFIFYVCVCLQDNLDLPEGIEEGEWASLGNNLITVWEIIELLTHFHTHVPTVSMPCL